MQVAKNTVTLFHYVLTEAGGDQIEDSRSSEPMACLVGHDNVIVGLEDGLMGKQKGDSFSVTLLPEHAYGTRIEGATQRIPVKHLHVEGKLRPGVTVAVHTDQGLRQMVVQKVGRFNVDVDTNHPLAGKTLRFDIDIVDVREASDEEVHHGHAHGVGGHHH